MTRRFALGVLLMLITGMTVGADTAGTAPTVTTLAEVDAGTGGLSIDARGNIYSADFGAVLGDPSTAGTKVYRISPDGSTEIFAEGLDGASASEGRKLGPTRIRRISLE